MATDNTVRRTQEMRSSETQGKILDATVACLIESGYSGTSTPEVCRRAGMSRGALLHHFPTKTELVVKAVAHLAALRAEEIRDGARRMAGKSDPLEAVFELMWMAFSGPLFHAALELWVAARSDEELHAALYPVERTMGKGIYALWSDLGDLVAAPDERASARFDDVVALSIHLLRGMAVQRILKEDETERRASTRRSEHFAQACGRFPVCASTGTIVIPGGLLKGPSGRPSSACFMKSIQIGSAARPPVSRSPRLHGSSRPTQTPTTGSGE